MAKKEEAYDQLQQLKNALKAKDPGRLYIFHGEEVFLLNHYLQKLKELLIEELTESFNYHRFTNETFDVQSFADAVENIPMMAEFSMVQVDDIDIFKLAEDARNKVAEVLSDIPDYCTVVFTYETVAWKADKRFAKLYAAIEKNGSVVEFPKQDQRDLVTWITRHFLTNKKRITADLCIYLIEITDGTMTALRGEIDKICAYSGADEICKQDIDAVVEPVMDAVVFQMTDLLGSGRFTQALEKLHQLLKMQEDPIAILGAIGVHFRRISTARILIDNGRPASELASLYGMKEYPARKTMEAARRFPPEFCKKTAELILQTDYRMKTSFDEQERLLEMLLLQLAQEARA